MRNLQVGEHQREEACGAIERLASVAAPMTPRQRNSNAPCGTGAAKRPKPSSRNSPTTVL
jgi:hypothetical protein